MTSTTTSPEACRLRTAADALNVAEGRLILDLLSSDAKLAGELIRAVQAARAEFDAAWDAFEATAHACTCGFGYATWEATCPEHGVATGERNA